MTQYYLLLLPVAFFAGILVAGSVIGLATTFFDTVRALGRMAAAAVARAPVARLAISAKAGEEQPVAESAAA